MECVGRVPKNGLQFVKIVHVNIKIGELFPGSYLWDSVLASTGLSSGAVQYSLVARSIFSLSWGPFSWSTILVLYCIPSMMPFTFTSTSTSSLNMMLPSGLRILSISSRMSTNLHLGEGDIDGASEAANSFVRGRFTKAANLPVLVEAKYGIRVDEIVCSWVSRHGLAPSTKNDNSYVFVLFFFIYNLE